MHLQFFVPGVPKPQPRVRAVIRGKHAGVYDPGTANTWRASVAMKAADEVPHAPYFVGPVLLGLDFFFPRPKGHFKKNGDLRGSAPRRHLVKPDAKNLLAAVEDALNGIAWRDDKQIVELRVRKAFSDDTGHSPGCRVTITALEPDLEEQAQQSLELDG